jgi:hypothetical protein
MTISFNRISSLLLETQPNIISTKLKRRLKKPFSQRGETFSAYSALLVTPRPPKKKKETTVDRAVLTQSHFQSQATAKTDRIIWK